MFSVVVSHTFSDVSFPWEFTSPLDIACQLPDYEDYVYLSPLICSSRQDWTLTPSHFKPGLRGKYWEWWKMFEFRNV